MVDFPDRQLGPSDKITFSPFSYAKAIIKDDATYPIIPNCPIIYDTGSYQNIPVGTFFIFHLPRNDGRDEMLCLRVPDDTEDGDRTLSSPGAIKLGERRKEPSSSQGGDVNEASAQ